MAKVEEFIPYSIVVFDVTFVYDDNALSSFRNWWIWVTILALLWWLDGWAISTCSIYFIVIVSMLLLFVVTKHISHLWCLKSLTQELVNLGHYFSLALLAGWLSHFHLFLYFIVIVSMLLLFVVTKHISHLWCLKSLTQELVNERELMADNELNRCWFFYLKPCFNG